MIGKEILLVKRGDWDFLRGQVSLYRLCRNYKKVILRAASKGCDGKSEGFCKMRSISVNLPFSINML